MPMQFDSITKLTAQIQLIAVAFAQLCFVYWRVMRNFKTEAHRHNPN